MRTSHYEYKFGTNQCIITQTIKINELYLRVEHLGGAQVHAQIHV